jgi:hypothetical protein
MNALGDPILELHDSNGLKLSRMTTGKTLRKPRSFATTVPPTNNLESAIVTTLSPDSYTAIVRGKNNATGVCLVELYNIAPPP